MVGLYSSKSDVDFRVGNAAHELRSSLTAVGNIKLWLDAKTDPELEALGYSTGDVAILRSAIGDLDKLRRIYLGQEVQATVYDFQTFAKNLA